MSRDKAIQQLLGDTELRVKAIKPSGDCFYEAVSTAFETVEKDVREMVKVSSEPNDSPVMALRRTVAGAVNEEVLSDFKMFHEAGLPDFSFMRRIRTVEDLQSRLLVSGKETGAGQCLWANEYEIGVVCSALDIVCLIIDQQARNEANRFVTIGGQSSQRTQSTKFVILQRTRREHYNLIFCQSDTIQSVFALEELSETVRKLWKVE